MDIDDLCIHIDAGEYNSVFNIFANSNAHCPWCYARTRSFYPEFDKAQAEHIRDRGGPSMEMLQALGHSITEDGALMVNSATSDADPNCYRDVLPPTRIREGFRAGKLIPPRPATICRCGVVDYDPTDDRGLQGRLDAIRNIAEELHQDYIAFNLEAARKFIYECQNHPALAGKDKEVLRRATSIGFRHK